MEIDFKTSKLQKLFNSQKKLRGEYGDRMSSLIMLRMADLSAADNLLVMKNIGRCHELKENYKGYLAVDLVHPQRLIFKPNHNPLPISDGGGLDWGRVTKITIIDVLDYH